MDHGERLQYSVYICDLTEVELIGLRSKLRDKITSLMTRSRSSTSGHPLEDWQPGSSTWVPNPNSLLKARRSGNADVGLRVARVRSSGTVSQQQPPRERCGQIKNPGSSRTYFLLQNMMIRVVPNSSARSWPTSNIDLSQEADNILQKVTFFSEPSQA